MGKIIIFTNLTLDGVMQGAGRPDEDRRGGFEHGGWATPYNAMANVTGDSLANAGPILLGRRTYEDFYGFWPQRTGNPISTLLDNTQKYVVSTTLKEPLPWQNSTLLNGDIPKAVADLKSHVDKDLLVMGSGELIQTLMAHDLVDRYVLLIHPIVLGSGQRLFRDGSPFAELQLVESETTSTGVVITTYRPRSASQGVDD